LILRWYLPALAVLIAPITLAVLIMRLRRPRPPFSRCFRQPGAAACAAATTFFVLDVLTRLLDLIFRFSADRMGVVFHTGSMTTSLRYHVDNLFGPLALWVGEWSGMAVAGAYLALWATGLWRSQPSWIDRTGRVLGWLWMLMGLGVICLPLKD
jgi:hypothetical protein